MQEITFSEANGKLGGLIDQVAGGDEFIITRDGSPVARLVAAGATFDRERARRAAEGLLEASKGLSLGGLSIKDLVNEGRP